MSTVSLRTLLSATCLVAVVPCAIAADSAPSFNYAAIHYQEFETEADRNFDGFNLEVSGHLSESWFISGSYAQLSHDLGEGSLNRDLTYGRLGYVARHQGGLALYAGPQIMYTTYEFMTNIDTESSTSAGVFAGVRYMVSPSVELKTEVSYANFSHDNNNNFIQYTAGLRTFLTYRFALEARAQFGDWDGFMVGGSIHF